MRQLRAASGVKPAPFGPGIWAIPAQAFQSKADAVGTAPFAEGDPPKGSPPGEPSLISSPQPCSGDTPIYGSIVSCTDLNAEFTALRLGNTERAEQALQQSLTLARELNDDESIALSSMWLGALSVLQEQYDKGNVFFGEALEKSRNTRNQNLVARVLNARGENARIQKDYRQALIYYEEALVVYRAIGHQHAITGVPLNIAHAAAALGQRETAIQNFCGVMTASLRAHDLMLTLDALAGLACVKLFEEQPDYIAQVISFIMSHPSTHLQTKMAVQPTLEKLQQDLPSETYQSAMSKGKNLRDCPKRLKV